MPDESWLEGVAPCCVGRVVEDVHFSSVEFSDVVGWLVAVDASRGVSG